MKHLPLAAKVILNIFLYILYVLFVSLMFSILFPLILQLMGKEVLDPSTIENMELFNKIQIFIIVLVLLLTLILRKYFYMSLKQYQVEKKEGYTAKKAIVLEKKDEQKYIDTKIEEEDDEDIKIYIEKEIK